LSADIQNSYKNILEFDSSFSFDFSNFGLLDVGINFSVGTFDLNGVTFSFDPNTFEFDSATFDFSDLNFDFDNLTVTSDFVTVDDRSMTVDSEMMEVHNDSITLDSDPFLENSDAVNFDFSLFEANANLFEYKFNFGGVSNFSFDELNDSDFKALEFAFSGDELFDTDYYIDKNFSIIPQGMNPFTHYVETGANQGLDPNPLFDTSYYLAKNPDVARDGVNALRHFAVNGYKEDNSPRDPNALFDTSYYRFKNPDVVRADANSLQHFIEHGYKEDNLPRDPNALFDTSYYRLSNPDVLRAGANSLQHFIEHGYKEDNLPRDPNALFDTSYYRFKNPDVVRADANSLQHFIEHGYKEDNLPRDPNALFDTSYYRLSNSDVLRAGANSLQHFLEFGFKESIIRNNVNFNPNRNPHPLFNTSYYFNANPDVLEAGVNPLVHELEFGLSENRLTHPIFNSTNQLFYVKQLDPKLAEDVATARNLGNSLNLNISPKQNNTFEIAQGNDEFPIFRELKELFIGIFLGGSYIASEFIRGGYNLIINSNNTLFLTTDPNTSFPFFPIPGFDLDSGVLDPRIRSFPGGFDAAEITQDVFINPSDSPIELYPIPNDSQRNSIFNGVAERPFVFPGFGEQPIGDYVFTIDSSGNNIAFDPTDLSNLENNSWDSIIQNGGRLTNFNTVNIPVRQSDGTESTHGALTLPNTSGQINFVSGNSDISVRVRNEIVVPNDIVFQSFPNEQLTSAQIRSRTNITLSHVEGSAASVLRTYNIPRGEVTINNASGPCFFCQTGIPRILDNGQILEVIYENQAGQLVIDTFTGGQRFNPATDRQIDPF
jgi:hypothetical protein